MPYRSVNELIDYLINLSSEEKEDKIINRFSIITGKSRHSFTKDFTSQPLGDQEKADTNFERFQEDMKDLNNRNVKTRN